MSEAQAKVGRSELVEWAAFFDIKFEEEKKATQKAIDDAKKR